jgi:mRNA interferase MazF
MKKGDVILTALPQADGKVKYRPAVYLCEMPPYHDPLVCGISTQVQHIAPGFDESITNQDDDFSSSDLLSESIIRLGFLAVIPRRKIAGSIGNISHDRHRRLLAKLVEYLVQANT